MNKNKQNYLIIEEQFIADGTKKTYHLMNKAIEMENPIVRLVYGFAYYNGEELKPDDGVIMTDSTLEFDKPPQLSDCPIVVNYVTRKDRIRVPINLT
jgi:hypothetical protein